jgi:uncharacterized protein (DUF362 family)
MNPRTVAVCQAQAARYPTSPPYHPDTAYPEYPLAATADEPNLVYQTVRECFHRSGLDLASFGRPEWNPLGAWISPGQTVLLKPNMVNQWHPRDPEGSTYVVTHGSVLRAAADYVWKALDGRGRIVVADAPETYASFEEVAQKMGLHQIRDFYRSQGLEFDLIDLRNEEWVERDGVVVERRRIGGDPGGCVKYNLADLSEFVGHGGGGRYYGADYDTSEVNRHHTGGRHEYLIASSAITCDVILSLPKLKTHRKAGITVSLKNLVGVNGEKNWLPHHTEGDPSNGGDEHPAPDVKHRTERRILFGVRWLSVRVPVIGPWIHRHARSVGRRIFGDTEDVIRGGNWSGNDTIWRMCLDLNKIILYGRPDGQLRPEEPASRKPHLVLVDAIIAGEGRGPTNPDPVKAGLLVFGSHPASVDAACARLMGFDPDRIPIVRQAFRCRRYPLTEWGWPEVRLVSNRPDWDGATLDGLSLTSVFRFVPHYGWHENIEMPEPESAGMSRTSDRSATP